MPMQTPLKHILKMYDHLQNIFGSNLYGMGIHWDNRNEDCYEEILETILALKNLQKWGVRLGISGIKYPALYYKTAEIGSDWLIQVKEFPGHTFGRQEYCRYFANNPYIAYGLSHFINQGFELNHRIRKKSYFIGLDYLAKNGSLQGFIVAPSSLSQGKELLNYFQNL
jgi:hypothetical protein